MVADAVQRVKQSPPNEDTPIPLENCALPHTFDILDLS